MRETDWAMAIERQRGALARVVEGLFVIAGIGCGAIVHALPREVRSRILVVLRPAESALRRLLVAAANNIAVDLPPLKAANGDTSATTSRAVRPDKAAVDGTARFPAFPLLDPLKRFDFGPVRRRALVQPRIHDFDSPFVPTPSIPEPQPDDPVDAKSICLRLNTLDRALKEFDRQAVRMARLQARSARSGLPDAPFQRSPMRPGWPPGRRKRRSREVDDILYEASILARDAYKPPGTSYF